MLPESLSIDNVPVLEVVTSLLAANLRSMSLTVMALRLPPIEIIALYEDVISLCVGGILCVLLLKGRGMVLGPVREHIFGSFTIEYGCTVFSSLVNIKASRSEWILD